MFELLGRIYDSLIYIPLLNLLQLFYNFTGDIGISIALLAIVVNLAMWPLFASAYINGQKLKVYQPFLTDIREKNKDNPQQLLSELREFNKKHGIRNNSLFIVLIVQLVLASALWSLTRNISSAQEIGGLVELPGVYESFFGRSVTNFQKEAFGFIQIGQPSTDFIVIPIVTAFLSFFYGYYTFKLAPKPKLLPAKKKKEDSGNQNPLLDPEAMQKSLEIQTIYLFPFLTLFVNLGLTIGVSIYFFAVTLLSLIRQIVLTIYYAGRTDKLLDAIADSDPTSKDNDPTNNIDIVPEGEITGNFEVPELVIDEKKDQTKTKSSKKIKLNKINNKKKKK